MQKVNFVIIKIKEDPILTKHEPNEFRIVAVVGCSHPRQSSYEGTESIKIRDKATPRMLAEPLFDPDANRFNFSVK